jgi:hypothetical protein
MGFQPAEHDVQMTDTESSRSNLQTQNCSCFLGLPKMLMKIYVGTASALTPRERRLLRAVKPGSCGTSA